MLEILGDRFTFAVILVLMMVGLYAVIATGNLVKRMVGLSIFQTSVFLLYIATAKVTGGASAIFNYSDLSAGTIPDDAVYANPLPHVLILTAIVVGVARWPWGWRSWCASARSTAPSRTMNCPRSTTMTS